METWPWPFNSLPTWKNFLKKFLEPSPHRTSQPEVLATISGPLSETQPPEKSQEPGQGDPEEPPLPNHFRTPTLLCPLAYSYQFFRWAPTWSSSKSARPLTYTHTYTICSPAFPKLYPPNKSGNQVSHHPHSFWDSNPGRDPHGFLPGSSGSGTAGSRSFCPRSAERRAKVPGPGSPDAWSCRGREGERKGYGGQARGRRAPANPSFHSLWSFAWHPTPPSFGPRYPALRLLRPAGRGPLPQAPRRCSPKAVFTKS